MNPVFLVLARVVFGAVSVWVVAVVAVLVFLAGWSLRPLCLTWEWIWRWGKRWAPVPYAWKYHAGFLTVWWKVLP